MTARLSTVETAKLIRTALKKAFPGTKFYVTKDTGTASCWINVRWIDGPLHTDVDAILDTFKNTDEYLVAGILSFREISDAAFKNIYAQMAKNNRTVAVVTADGKPNENLNPDFVSDLYVSTFNIRGARDVRDAAYQIAQQVPNPAELTYA